MIVCCTLDVACLCGDIAGEVPGCSAKYYRIVVPVVQSRREAGCVRHPDWEHGLFAACSDAIEVDLQCLQHGNKRLDKK